MAEIAIPLLESADTARAMLPEFVLLLGIVGMLVLPNLGDGRFRVPFRTWGVPYFFGGKRWSTQRDPENTVDRFLNKALSPFTSPQTPFIIAASTLLAAFMVTLDSQRQDPLIGLNNVAITATVGGEMLLKADNFSRLFSLIFIAAFGLAIAANRHRLPVTPWSQIPREALRGAAEEQRQQQLMNNRRQADFYVLVLMAALGMSFMALAQNLFVLLVGLELAGMASYVMVAFLKETKEGSEAGLKYFIVGATSSAVGLYGASLLYLWSGTLQLTGAESLQASWAGMRSLEVLPLIGIGFVIVGFGFKIAAAPFHLAAPDAYAGAAAPVAGVLATASKAMGFVGLLRVLVLVTLPEGDGSAAWIGALGILAAVTMTWGNIAALGSRNPKRMLAYSSVAHAGYMLAGLVAIGAWRWGELPSEDAESIVQLIAAAILIHLVVLVSIKLGAFLVISGLEQSGKGTSLDDFAGLGRRQPMIGVMMLMFMLALAGVPPFSGFMSKLLLIGGIVDLGVTGDIAVTSSESLWDAITAVHWIVWLGLLVLLNSAISVFYYLRIIVVMFFDEPEGRPTHLPAMHRAPGLYLALWLCAIGAIAFGVFIDPLADQAGHAARALLHGLP